MVYVVYVIDTQLFAEFQSNILGYLVLSLELTWQS
jgi:hypothetical protein